MVLLEKLKDFVFNSLEKEFLEEEYIKTCFLEKSWILDDLFDLKTLKNLLFFMIVLFEQNTFCSSAT